MLFICPEAGISIQGMAHGSNESQRLASFEL
jgi:hypothetical protein